MIIIKEITFVDVRPYKLAAEVSGLVFSSTTKYFGLYNDSVLQAFCGVLYFKNKVVMKNVFVLPQYRGLGYFKELVNYRLKLFAHKTIEATCTKMSSKYYKELGFKEIKLYKNGCVKFTKKNNL